MSNKLDSNSKIHQSEPEKITNGLDPRLQEVILKTRDRIPLDASFSYQEVGGTILVDILARLKFPDRDVPGLKIIRKIGNIVTGQISVSDIEMVRANQNVESLKLAEKLRPELDFSINEINGTPAQMATALPSGTTTFNGEDVIVGIVDYGCDFRHNNFRNEDGTTRLICLWDQQGSSSSLSPQPYNYGREFNSSAINSALNTTNPYATLAYDPSNNAHGTHVMDIAAGNGRATGVAGVAPQADLIFVHLSHDDIDLIQGPDGEQVSSFGNSKMLLEAVEYIFEKAQELGRPAVVNMSVGTHGGPHDGSTLAEHGFDELLTQPNRAIVIAAGNSHDDRSHAQGNVTDSSPRTLTWRIHPEDDTSNELEIWYDGDQELEVALETPSGQRLNPVRLGTTVTLRSDGIVVGRIIHRADDPGNGDHHIDIILAASLPGGDWKVHVSGTTSDEVHFHAWIERDFPNSFAPNRQSRFAEVDNDSSYTIGSIACGQSTIAVGSYLSGVPDHEISPFSAAGPTRNGRQKPEISAPGQFLHPFVGILAARSLSQGTTRIPGTSMAAPHVAGVIALLMQAANRDLTIDEIRQAILTTARKSNPTLGSDWNPRYGFGRVDTVAAILKVLPTALPSSIAPSGVSTTALSSDGNVLVEMVLNTAKIAQSSKSKIKIQIEFEPVS